MHALLKELGVLSATKQEDKKQKKNLIDKNHHTNHSK